MAISALICLNKTRFEINPGEVLPEELGDGVRLASQNSYPIDDQNLRYSLPYLWPDQKFKTLFMTWPLNQNTVSDLRFLVN